MTLISVWVEMIRVNRRPAEEQSAVFRLGPLAAARHHQHIQIHVLTEACGGAALNYASTSRTLPFVAIAVPQFLENGHRPLVIPIVNDPLKHINVPDRLLRIPQHCPWLATPGTAKARGCR